jgi:hypothetical protein
LLLADELAVVVVVEPVAALGVDGPPPQAATATPTARIPAVTNAAQRNRGGRLGSRQESGEMSFCCEMSCITPSGFASVSLGSCSGDVRVLVTGVFSWGGSGRANSSSR